MRVSSRSEGMIPLEQALATVDKRLAGRRLPVETVPVRAAASRFLAHDQQSKVDLPPFDKAAVDGYAIAADDARDEYDVVATVAAGEPGVGPLQPGSAVKVMTGAPLPPGTARVIMVELSRERAGRVCFEAPSPASNICKKAENVAAGQKILSAGTRLDALHIANLIGCGISEVPVAQAAQLAILSTGDEIVDSPAKLEPGKIMNTNGPLLAGLARKFGLTVAGERTVRDDESELAASIREALAAADIVVLSGGVSAGDYDFVPEVISELGLRTHFARVAVKPGMPTVFATGEKGVLFGLPGNPVAVYLMFHLFVLRAVALASGGRYEPRRLKLRLGHDLTRRSAARMEYAPCRFSADGMVEKVSYHGSSDLPAVQHADGFLVIPQGIKSLSAGADVTVVLLGEGNG